MIGESFELNRDFSEKPEQEINGIALISLLPARPLLPKERVAGETVCVRVMPGTSQIVLGRDRVFTFDHVFSAASTQGEVYSRCIEPLVQSCFEGYNATVFAYGQTGSGKTYTIGGGSIFSQTSEDTGIVARAIQQIFRMIQSDCHRKFTVKVSYIEIYREELHDLVDLSLNKDLHIREDNRGTTMIVGATEVECDTADDVMSYLERGSAYRHTGSTQMNEKSSRSHSVFTVLIEQRRVTGAGDQTESNRKLDELTCPAGDAIDMHYKCAKFHFVDLAGSERAHRTGNVGQRFKESVHINTGLLALGNVISALGDVKRKTTHIPYRDSKITRLLKDSLGGNAKTLMICCISPSSANLDESLNSLKYANRARNIKNKPIVNLDPQSTKIEVMESEIKSLREQLFRATTASTFVRDGETGEDPGSNDLRRDLEKVHSIYIHYRALAEEAYVQLSELRDREFLSDHQNQRLYDWLELMDEMMNNQDESLFVSETNVNPVIRQLQKELEQCQRDLQSDAEIFLEKKEEADSANEKALCLEADNGELMRRLEEAEDAINRLKGELLEKQVEMDKLVEKIKEMPTHRSADASLNMSSPALAPHSSRPGAKSAPLRALDDHSTVKKLEHRNIHTSPPMFTLEHVVHSFRARSQMLINQLEEEDEVLTKNYHSDYDEEEEQEESVNGKGFKRNVNSRQTYRVKQSHVLSSVSDTVKDSLSKPQSSNQRLDGPEEPNIECFATPTDAAVLKNSVDLKQQKLKKNEINFRQSTAKFRNLTINIRMKEQLIRHMVRNEKDAQEVNRIFLEKIRTLEKEKAAAKAELVGLQKDFELKHQQDKAMNEQLQSEFRKKMEAAKQRLKSLKSQQKETESMVNLTDNTKKIQDLRMSVSSMQKQQAELQKQLKDDAELKVILEGDVRKEREELDRMKHQKTTKRELLTANLRDNLESGKSVKGIVLSDEQLRLEEQRRWLEMEMEKLLEQRRTAEELDKELKQREELLAKKEAMLLEKRELEMKVLRSSQNPVRSSPRTDTDNVQQHLDEQVNQMRLERDRLKQERNSLNTRMQETSGLSTQEQRKLMELEEMIEAMDAALEYKSELISQKQMEMRRSVQSLQGSNSALSKLRFLSLTEARSLLARYFEKVVDLRDNQRKLEHHCEELEMAIDEERSLVQELETSLQHSAMETERKLLQQQHDYEQKLQLMMKNLTESELSSQPKIAELEKELYFYKTTCRSLKKHLRDVTGASSTSASSSKLGSADENQPSYSLPNHDDGARSPRAAPPAPLDMAAPTNHGSSTKGVSRNGGQTVTGPRDDLQSDADRCLTISPRALRVGSPRDVVPASKTPQNVGESSRDVNLISARELTQKDAAVRSHVSLRRDGSLDERERSGTHRKTIPDTASVNSSERKTTKGHGGHSRKHPSDRNDSSRVQSSDRNDLSRVQSGDRNDLSRVQSGLSQEDAASLRPQRPSDFIRHISSPSVVAELAVKSPRINKTDLSQVDSKTSKNYDLALRSQSGLDRNMTGADRTSLQTHDQGRTKLFDSLEN